MTIQFSIFDDQTQSIATVSRNGELIVAPISYSTSYFVLVDVAATAFEIVPALSNHQFIVTDILIASSKTFGSATTAETITLYEASPADLDTNLKTITQIDMLKNDRMVAIGLNLATTEAVSIVASATDNDVSVTVAGYYVGIR